MLLFPRILNALTHTLLQVLFKETHLNRHQHTLCIGIIKRDLTNPQSHYHTLCYRYFLSISNFFADINGRFKKYQATCVNGQEWQPRNTLHLASIGLYYFLACNVLLYCCNFDVFRAHQPKALSSYGCQTAHYFLGV